MTATAGSGLPSDHCSLPLPMDRLTGGRAPADVTGQRTRLAHRPLWEQVSAGCDAHLNTRRRRCCMVSSPQQGGPSTDSRRVLKQLLIPVRSNAQTDGNHQLTHACLFLRCSGCWTAGRWRRCWRRQGTEMPPHAPRLSQPSAASCATLIPPWTPYSRYSRTELVVSTTNDAVHLPVCLGGAACRGKAGH